MAETKAVEPKTKKIVRYVGTADTRIITDAQWAAAGVADQKSVEWNRVNGRELPATDFTADALRYCSDRDEGFAVVDVPA